MAERLRQHHWPAVVVPRAGGMHAVQIGPYHSEADVKQVADALLKREKLKGFVVLH
jgi:cell division septation protein DedD